MNIPKDIRICFQEAYIEGWNAAKNKQYQNPYILSEYERDMTLDDHMHDYWESGYDDYIEENLSK